VKNQIYLSFSKVQPIFMLFFSIKLKKIWEKLLSLQLNYELFRQIDKRNKLNG